MGDAILIAGAASRPRESADSRPRWWQRALRRRVLERLATLRSGSIRLRERGATLELGDVRGRLGTVELEVASPEFWTSLACAGGVGAGESFVAGHWSSPDLVRLLRLLVADRDVLLAVDRGLLSLPRRLLLRAGHWLRDNTRIGSARNIAGHYDLGDELFAQFLDPTMTYSSAWFAGPDCSLEDAQREKLRRLCRLVDLAPGDRLLEIGTGWGSLAVCAAREFGAHVTTTTISKNQFAAAKERARTAGVAHSVQVLQRDYRDLEGTFDKVLSCEMIEAVGAKWLPTFLRVAAARLRPGGLFGLQAITIRDQHYARAVRSVDYVKRHVFPGSFIPSVAAIVAAAANTDFRLVQMVDFGDHYATTLARWRAAMHMHPGAFRERGGDALLRAWDFYFAYCEAGFRERNLGVCQLRFERADGARSVTP